MTSEKQALGRGTQHLKRLVLLDELPARQLLVLAAAVGILSAASLFNWSFVIGGHAFWRFQRVRSPARCTTWRKC